MIEGKVGNQALKWLSQPKGKSGHANVELSGGRVEQVRWVRDEQGIWIETSQGVFGYDVRKSENDSGQAQYELLRRKFTEHQIGLQFLKAGENSGTEGGKTKKALKTKSQMPGKILRVLVKAGDAVSKGQALIVMEAMKMENEIKALQDGKVKEVKVSEGQAVETGAELLSFE